MRVVR
jgi:hypothetical protein